MMVVLTAICWYTAVGFIQIPHEVQSAIVGKLLEPLSLIVHLSDGTA